MKIKNILCIIVLCAITFVIGYWIAPEVRIKEVCKKNYQSWNGTQACIEHGGIPIPYEQKGNNKIKECVFK